MTNELKTTLRILGVMILLVLDIIAFRLSDPRCRPHSAWYLLPGGGFVAYIQTKGACK